MLKKDDSLIAKELIQREIILNIDPFYCINVSQLLILNKFCDQGIGYL